MTTSATVEDGPSVRPPSSSRATVASRLRQITATVLVLAVLAVVGIGVTALVRGTWMLTPILSGSMRPGLAVGGLAICERVPVKSVAVRDVIVFRRPDKPSEQVIHRIVHLRVSKSGQILINTQGDANKVRDPWTLTIRGEYVYEARWSIPLLGYPAVAYQNHRSFFLLGAGIVLLLVAASTLFETRRHQRVHAVRGSHGPVGERRFHERRIHESPSPPES